MNRKIYFFNQVYSFFTVFAVNRATIWQTIIIIAGFLEQKKFSIPPLFNFVSRIFDQLCPNVKYQQSLLLHFHAFFVREPSSPIYLLLQRVLVITQICSFRFRFLQHMKESLTQYVCTCPLNYRRSKWRTEKLLLESLLCRNSTIVDKNKHITYFVQIFWLSIFRLCSMP